MASPTDPHHQFDMTAPTEAWATFQWLAKWVVILCIGLVIFMAIFLTGHPPATH